MPSLDDLRQAYERQGLTGELYGIVKRAVAAVVWTRRIPGWRALDGTWDPDSIIALTDDFLMEGLNRGMLDDLLNRCSSLEELEREIEYRVQDYLRQTARRGPRGNLQAQVIHIMEKTPEFAPFSACGTKSNHVWGLAEWRTKLPATTFPEREREVRALLAKFQRPRYGAGTSRRPPALHADDLCVFLKELFRRTGMLWVVKDIVTMVAEELDVTEEQTTVSWEACMGDSHLSDSGEPQADIVDRIGARETASSFWDSSSEEERDLLRVLARGHYTVRDIGSALGFSGPTASRRRKALIEKLRTACQEDAFAELVWAELTSLALGTQDKEGAL
ncbi:MAG: hypothetical protein AB1700_06945 [Bacillota bacterium]